MDMFVVRSVVRGPMVQRQRTDKIDKALNKTKKPLIIGDIVLVIGTLMVADGVATGTKYLSVTAIPGPIIGLMWSCGPFPWNIKGDNDGHGIENPCTNKVIV